MKLLLAKSTGFADNQVDLPTACPVNHVEQRLPLVCFQRRIYIHTILVARQTLNECAHCAGVAAITRSMSWVDRGARVVSTGKRSGKHIRNASLIKRRRDPLEDFRDALALQGRFDKAFPQIENGRQLDPLSLIIATDYGAILYFSRQYDRAIEHFRGVLEMEPDFPRAHMLVWAYAQTRIVCRGSGRRRGVSAP